MNKTNRVTVVFELRVGKRNIYIPRYRIGDSCKHRYEYGHNYRSRFLCIHDIMQNIDKFLEENKALTVGGHKTERYF